MNKPSYEELEARVRQLENEISSRDSKREFGPNEARRVIDPYELMFQIVDNAPGLIWAKDMENRFIFANKSDCSILLKCDPEEAIGRNDMFFARRERANGHNHTFGEICVDSDAIVKKTRKPGRFLEYGLVRGKQLILDVQKEPFFNSSGEMVGTVGYGRDVTEQKQAKLSLANTSRILRELANDLHGIAVHACDEDREVTLWNRYCESLYGYTKEEALGKKIEDLIFPEEMRDDIIRLQQHCMETGEKVPGGELVLRHKNGEEVVVYSSHAAHTTTYGKEFFCIDIDLRPIREVEEKRRILEVQLQQAQKMEAIGVLAGGIAHDFNNILTGIVGYGELALDDCPPDSLVADEISQILHSADRAKKLVRQILDFSRESEVAQKPLLPGPILKETVKFLRSSLPSTITINEDIDMESGCILGDPTQMYQVFMNICTNSFHATEEKGGILSVSLKKIMITREDLSESDEIMPGSYIQIAIKDDGVGIHPADLDKIFNPYFTTKGVGKGTGMGLAIVHGIVNDYGGKITCKSQLGQGTAFHILLPAVEKEVVTFNDSDNFIPTGSERILFVDDEEMLAEMAKSMLERIGYSVTKQTSSIEALTLFRNEPDFFDLVITDQTMPELTGYDMSERMLAIRPDLPIILCTGYSSLITQEMVEASGIKEFSYKPLKTKDIAVLIRKVIDGDGWGEKISINNEH